MKKNKLLIIVLTLLGVLIIALVIARQAGWIGSPEGERVTVEQVAYRNILEIVTASGRVQPIIEVKISPDVSGEIIELPVREGAFVRRGELLARINPDLYESAVERMVATLNTSRANLANSRARASQADAQFINARAVFARNQSLFEQQAISESEYDAARAQFLVAQAEVEAARQSVIAAEFQVKSAQAAVTEARESLAKTSIFAPMDGTISRLDAELGERVVGTSQFAGTEIMRIANLTSMEVLVQVNERDVVRVEHGDSAIIEIDAFRDQHFKGVVTSISNSAMVTGQAVDQVTNFEVKIQIDPASYNSLINPETPHLSPFRPGMSASVEVQTRRVENAITVPIQAVTTRTPEESRGDTIAIPGPLGNIQEYVFVYQQGVARLQKVQSGLQDNHYIEIKEGLDTSMTVITGPFRLVSQDLNDGDPVIKSTRTAVFEQE